MREVIEYRRFHLSVERAARGWQVQIVPPKTDTIYIPPHLREVNRLKKEDAVADAKSVVDYLIGP
jgi:hypothetical protein